MASKLSRLADLAVALAFLALTACSERAPDFRLSRAAGRLAQPAQDA